MTTSTKTRLGLAAGLMLGTALPAAAQSDSLTLCWAAWDPANALVELSKDFTAESGIAMNFEFVPWPNFTDRILNELNAGGDLCDLLIGDSQWLGGSAENGYYVKLNDFFEAEGITMGATSVLYPFGFKYETEPGSYAMDGAVNSAEAVAGLEFYKELYDCCTPPGYTDSYMEQGLDAFKSGQVAMMMNWFAFMPGMAKDEVVGDVTGFFVNPAEKVPASTLGGQGISVVANTDNMDGALAYIKWFAQPEVQKKWWSLGGYACHNAVLNDPAFVDSQPFAGQFLEAMGQVQDFWQEPAYAQLLQAMQKRLHDYVVADQGTAQEALDQLIADWTEIFEDEGKL